MLAMSSGKLHNRTALPCLLAATILFSGCATVENHHDPIEGLNRATDSFNEIIDTFTLKPMAQAYVNDSGPKTRLAVSNFYDNLTYPNTILNDFLQGKTRQGVGDLIRLLINSTVGVLGLVDVAGKLGLEKHEEDLGQTLAVWGVPQGAYIIYPFFGPNSLRKTPDFITSTLGDGLFWLSFVLKPEITIPLTVIKYIDQRARLLDASDLRDELSLDPYVFTREAWRQRREYMIYDGNPPIRPVPASPEGEQESGDEWSSEPPKDDWSTEPSEDDGWNTKPPKESKGSKSDDDGDGWSSEPPKDGKGSEPPAKQ